MEMRNGKVYQNLKEEELFRRQSAQNDVLRSFREVIRANSIMVKSHGLVFCRGDPIVYASHGIENWDSALDMYICDPNEDFSKYGQSIRDWIGGLAYGIGVLAQKAFETYKTHLSISTYIQEGKLKGSIRLGICLKNIKIIGSQDFVFGMIFKLDDDNMCQPLVFLDSLFTNLEKCLPSFKVSSGAQIGLQSLVLDFDTFKALEKHQMSSPPYGYKDAIAEIGKATRILTKYHGLKCCRVWTTHSVNGRPDFRMGTKKGTDQCYAYLIDMRNIYTGDIEYLCELYYFKKIEKINKLYDSLSTCLPSFKLCSPPEFDTLGPNADSKAWVDKLSPLYEDNDGLKLAFVEIQKAISILTVHRGLTFCQVWTHHHSYKGLDPPYFSTGSRNPKDVGIHIPMRNTNTVDLDYAFKFFFSSVILTQNFCETFDSVLLTLADHVPSFKLSSGPQFDHLVLQAGSVIASVDQLSPSVKIKYSSVSASVKFANLKTEFSQLFHPVSSKNGIDIDYRLTYYSFQFTRPLWIQLENDQDLKMCISHCKSKKITQLPIRVVQCHTSIQGFHPRAARHAALVISLDEA